MLVKLYGPSSELAKGRYSPAECIGARNADSRQTRSETHRHVVCGAFSKKIENHMHSVALFAMYYNFVRIHKTLRTTPAMAAGATDRL